jgi:hypothetical protein
MPKAFAISMAPRPGLRLTQPDRVDRRPATRVGVPRSSRCPPCGVPHGGSFRTGEYASMSRKHFLAARARDGRPLDNLVLEDGTRERTLPPSDRNALSAGPQCPIRSPLPRLQILEVGNRPFVAVEKLISRWSPSGCRGEARRQEETRPETVFGARLFRPLHVGGNPSNRPGVVRPLSDGRRRVKATHGVSCLALSSHRRAFDKKVKWPRPRGLFGASRGRGFAPVGTGAKDLHTV